MNFGCSIGKFNDVGHCHLHIFPRYIGDGFNWIYGKDETVAKTEIAERIRESLGGRFEKG